MGGKRGSAGLAVALLGPVEIGRAPGDAGQNRLGGVTIGFPSAGCPDTARRRAPRSQPPAVLALPAGPSLAHGLTFSLAGRVCWPVSDPVYGAAVAKAVDLIARNVACGGSARPDARAAVEAWEPGQQVPVGCPAGSTVRALPFLRTGWWLLAQDL